MPKVSVIMPVYNGIRFLDKAIQSILNQTETDFEFIIIDDGSTEPVFEKIKSYNDKRIKAFSFGENKGLTYRLNQCLNEAVGEYIARMDGDDVSHIDRLKRQLSYFTTSDIGFVGCWGQTIDENGDKLSRYLDVHCKCTDEELKTIYPKKFCMIDASVVYSRKAVNKVGYYDAAVLTGESYNYARRIQQFFNGRIVPEILYYRTAHKDSIMSRRNKKIDVIVLANARATTHTIIKSFYE